MLHDASNFASLEEAVAQAVDGDSVYLPGTHPWVAPEGGLVISRNIEIFGDGPGRPGSYDGTVLMPAGENDSVIVLRPVDGELSNVKLRGFQITGHIDRPAPDGKHGVFMDVASGAFKVSNLRAEQVRVTNMRETGLKLVGLSALDRFLVGATIRECEVSGCGHHGLELDWATVINLSRCVLRGNALGGVLARNSGVMLVTCTLDGNGAGEGAEDGNARFALCHVVVLDGSELLNLGAAIQGNRIGCILENSPGALVLGCLFDAGATGQQTVGVQVRGVLGGPVALLPSRFVKVETLVDLLDQAAVLRDSLVMPQFSDPAGGPAGATVLTSGANVGTVGWPHRSSPAGALAGSGLMIPNLEIAPALNVQAGSAALFSGAVQARMNAAWQPIGFDGPDRITGAYVDSPTGKTTLVVRWNAPSAARAAATEYDLRYSLSPITDANFYDATRRTLGAPQAPATPECARLSGLTSCRTYYAAIKSRDAGGAWSAMSNVASGTTLCTGSSEVDCV